VNTVLLLIFLRRNPQVAVQRILGPAMAYALKLIALSGLAVLPVLALSPRLTRLWAGQGRLISRGLPLAVSALVYAAIGLALLLLTRDRQLRAILGMLRRRGASR
jgi:putative peptidoglycan lipid II flippase